MVMKLKPSKPGKSRPRFSLPKPSERGQSFVLLAVSFFALLAFIGLVTDAGSLYIAYTHLQRAVDSAAVAAANNIKFPQSTYAERKEKITEAAREMLSVHEITGVADLEVYLCDDSGKPSSFASMCPQTGQPPRKLAYVQATQDSPVFFLQLFGLHTFPLTTSSVGEAAAVDLVLVFDTSESMGVNTPGYDPRNFNPSTYDPDDIEPLHTAKIAAESLVANLFDGYDQVAIVTFDYKAVVQFNLSSNLLDARDAINDLIQLHDDPPGGLLKWTQASPNGGYRKFNPIFPDDRDGDGEDNDPTMRCVDEYVNNVDGTLGDPEPDMWADSTWGPGSPVQKGDPCDDDNMLDAYDWNENGVWREAGHPPTGDDTEPPYGLPYDPTNLVYEGSAVLSTCTGCGIREGMRVLQAGGRPTAIWVMVLLSDGVANLSDTHATNPFIPTSFTYGFCGADPDTAFWSTYCIDPNSGAADVTERYCIDNDADECPPGTTHTTTSGPYSVEDYALDLIDEAGLTASLNENEPRGEDIVMYSIGLGTASAGEPLLRYMANVGDEGSRANDPCDGIPALKNCGNYYYSPSAAYLNQIFESIANRIFTKISR
jgi:hypothetical protein